MTLGDLRKVACVVKCQLYLNCGSSNTLHGLFAKTLGGQNFVGKCRSPTEISWEGAHFISRMDQSGFFFFFFFSFCVCIAPPHHPSRPPTSWRSACAWWKKGGPPSRDRFVLLPNMVVPWSTWRPPVPCEASQVPYSSALDLPTVFIGFANQRTLSINLNKLAMDFFSKETFFPLLEDGIRV